MSVNHMRVDETVMQTGERIANARRNRMRLVSHYINVQTIVFYDQTGSQERKGVVIGSNERCLILKFQGDYVETFFYEELLALELKNRINAK